MYKILRKACIYVASVRDISDIVCYHQVLFAAVTKLQQWEDKTTNIFAASGFHKIPRIIYCACAHMNVQLYVTGKKIPVYTVCSQFKHYVGLVNLPHSSTCPMLPYKMKHVFEADSTTFRIIIRRQSDSVMVDVSH